MGFLWPVKSCSIKLLCLRILIANNWITTICDLFYYTVSLAAAMSCRIATAQTKVQSTI